MTGTDKRLLLILSKSAKLRCFQNVKSFQQALKPGQVTSLWNGVTKIDKTCQRQKRKCALVVDNWPDHPKVKGLKNMSWFFLTLNTPSKTQPMDQGLIRNWRHNNRKLVIARHLRAIEKKKEIEKITFLVAMYYLQQAKETTIANCYTKAGSKTTKRSTQHHRRWCHSRRNHRCLREQPWRWRRRRHIDDADQTIEPPSEPLSNDMALKACETPRRLEG